MAINAQKNLMAIGVGALDIGAGYLDESGWSPGFATSQEAFRLVAALAAFGAQGLAPKYAGNWAEPVGLAVLPLVMHSVKERLMGGATAPAAGFVQSRATARPVGNWVPSGRRQQQDSGYRET